MIEPKCPSCGTVGVEHMVSQDSKEKSKTKQPWFVVVYCSACGHVYNVLAKHVFSVPVTPTLTLPDLD
jgi:uncharacterized Zn finger protein